MKVEVYLNETPLFCLEEWKPKNVIVKKDGSTFSVFSGNNLFRLFLQCISRLFFQGYSSYSKQVREKFHKRYFTKVKPNRFPTLGTRPEGNEVDVEHLRGHNPRRQARRRAPEPCNNTGTDAYVMVPTEEEMVRHKQAEIRAEREERVESIINDVLKKGSVLPEEKMLFYASSVLEDSIQRYVANGDEKRFQELINIYLTNAKTFNESRQQKHQLRISAINSRLDGYVPVGVDPRKDPNIWEIYSKLYVLSNDITDQNFSEAGTEIRKLVTPYELEKIRDIVDRDEEIVKKAFEYEELPYEQVRDGMRFLSVEETTKLRTFALEIKKDLQGIQEQNEKTQNAYRIFADPFKSTLPKVNRFSCMEPAEKIVEDKLAHALEVVNIKSEEEREALEAALENNSELDSAYTALKDIIGDVQEMFGDEKTTEILGIVFNSNHASLEPKWINMAMARKQPFKAEAKRKWDSIAKTIKQIHGLSMKHAQQATTTAFENSSKSRRLSEDRSDTGSELSD